jgi:DNA topoisomerase VI subunit B
MKPWRPRLKTEMAGTLLTKVEYEILQAECRRRKISVSEYLRETAVAPLVAAQAEVEPDGAVSV